MPIGSNVYLNMMNCELYMIMYPRKIVVCVYICIYMYYIVLY